MYVTKHNSSAFAQYGPMIPEPMAFNTASSADSAQCFVLAFLTSRLWLHMSTKRSLEKFNTKSLAQPACNAGHINNNIIFPVWSEDARGIGWLRHIDSGGDHRRTGGGG